MPARGLRSGDRSSASETTSTENCRCDALSAYALALSGEGGGFADSAGEVVIVHVIVHLIDSSCRTFDYVDD